MVAVGGWLTTTRLCAWRKTSESYAPSPASAIARRIVFVCPFFTAAVQVRTTVRPSSSVLIGAEPSWKSLLRYNDGLELGVVPNGLPLLIVLIDTGSGGLPTTAQF